MPAVIGHEGILRELRSLALSDEPPHALLFAGPEGTGRRLLALDYARWLNCERVHPPVTAGAPLFGDDSSLAPQASSFEAPCGECRPCHLIDTGVHPDVVVLGPGDVLCKPRGGEAHERHPQSRDIRICQVRGLIELSARYPFEARYRLVVIDPAERLAREAAHTILKTLEEPPGQTVFALLTSAPEALLETIVSRCRRITVPIVARAVIEAGLVARGVGPALAARAAEASRGRPGIAIEYTEDPSRMGDLGRLLERCAETAAAGLGDRFTHAADLAERFRRDRAIIVPELEAWESFWERDLRAAAVVPGPEGREQAAGALRALQAVRQVRDDLLANVNARTAIERMLLRFPRRTLEADSEEVPASAAP